MNIDDIQFEVSALLGKALIPVTAYFDLQVGDILVLDQPIEQGLVVRVGIQERYLATAGLFEIHKAIKIDERIHS
jgi:flagellar motor switch protein FliM